MQNGFPVTYAMVVSVPRKTNPVWNPNNHIQVMRLNRNCPSTIHSLDVYTNREQISRDDTDDDVAVEEDTSNSFKGYTFVRKKHTPS